MKPLSGSRIGGAFAAARQGGETVVSFGASRRAGLRLMISLLALVAMLPAPGVAAGGSGVVLLVASGRIDSPVFGRSVILATRHGAGGGAIGLILNRPTSHRLSDLDSQESAPTASPRVYLGGPVETERLIFLVRTDSAFERALELMPGLFMSENTGALQRFLDGSAESSRLRVFRGFSGWAPGQLEAEIRRGDWVVLPVDESILFSDPDTLWERIQAPPADDRLVLLDRVRSAGG